MSSLKATDAEVDVCIVGAGPAGAALALRLAQLGRRVAIAERMAFPRQHVGEALSPGVIPLLEALGAREVLERSGALVSSWATVEWAGERRRDRMDGEPGFLVDRARFDAYLLKLASAMSGVRLYQPSRVLEAKRVAGCWEVALQSGETIRARYLAEASGRTRFRIFSEDRLVHRKRRRCGSATLAMYAYWRDVGDSAEGEVIVESGREAWYWGALLPGGEFNAMVFVNPDAGADYDESIRESKLLNPLLRNARRVGELRICDATPFADQEPIDSTSIRVGDAALSIDPISSQGVQAALGTSLHAAIVLNTVLDRPEDRELAENFYRGRLLGSAAFHAGAAGDLYRRQADLCGGDFWRKRAPPVGPAVSRGEVGPGSGVMLSPALEFGPVAVATVSHVVRCDGVRAHGKDFAFVGQGLAVSSFLRELDRPMLAVEVVRRWSRRLPAVRALQVLRWAWEEGLVVDRNFTPASNSSNPSNW